MLLQKDTDGTPLFVPDSASSSGIESDSTEAEEVAAYCQVRNIWTILGGNLNKPGAKQATKVWILHVHGTCVQRGGISWCQGRTSHSPPYHVPLTATEEEELCAVFQSAAEAFEMNADPEEGSARGVWGSGADCAEEER